MINVIRLNATRKTPNPDSNHRRKSGDITLLNNQTEIMVIPELSSDILPAQYSAQSILLELFSLFERKLNQFCNDDPLDKIFNKSLRRGEDPYLDNLLKTLHGVCEVCLPPVLTALHKWHEDHQNVPINENGEAQEKAMKRTLGASYLYCIVLIEILPQVQFYPSECDQLINQILVKSFKQVSYRDPQRFGANYNNSLCVAETFAEVIGVLSQSHFNLIHKMFSEQLDLLRKETPSSVIVTRKIISLLMAMKFVSLTILKTNQVCAFEVGVKFLNELGSYYLEVDLKQKDLKHALAGLLVEILAPAAGEIKTEANIPSLIKFVDSLYSATYELVNKKNHKMAAYPLITCLLCVSTTKFFLSNWVQFLNLTLANLKNKDPKMARIALESLYRLLWVYTIRINCEGNANTRSRLESICSSLFPKGNRNVIPKDSPINIFVKVIHFIAYQKLDYAFEEIIFDLLRVSRSIYPERMNIGIRALIVIIDGLQQKEGPPKMPQSLGNNMMPSGTVQRIKRTYITRPLTHDVAVAIGLDKYLLRCRKAFDSILRSLDTQVSRNFLLTDSQIKGKEPKDLLIGDVKPKLDLLRTCIAAIPRILPDPMSHQELIELLIRITIHIDEELRVIACQTIQNLITECSEWREEIINTYLKFLTKDIQDTYPQLLESAVRFLLQLLCAWKSSIQMEKKNAGQIIEPRVMPWMIKKNKVLPTPSEATTCSVSDSVHSQDEQTIGSIGSELSSPYNRANIVNQTAQAIHNVEGLALMLLCQSRPQTKRIAISLLKECRLLLSFAEVGVHDTPLISVLDEATPYILKKYIEHVPNSEKQSWGSDFAFICDKISSIESETHLLVNGDRGNEYMRWDPWACALSGYCEYQFLPIRCPTAVAFTWPAIFRRLNHCTQFVDPLNPQNDQSRGSLLRGSKSKASSTPICGEAISHEGHLQLWQKYMPVCCALVPPPNSANNRSFSPGLSLESDAVRSMTSSIRTNRAASMDSAPLFVKVSNMMRWENMTDMRDSVVLGIGSTNPACFEFLFDEMANRNILREVQERKLESNVRRRKRKDLLRLQVLRVIEIGFFRGLLEHGNMIDHQTGQMSSVLLKTLEAIKDHVVSDSDRDISVLTSLRLHFAKAITLAINSVSTERRKFLFPPQLKRELISIFYKWASNTIGVTKQGSEKDVGTYVEVKALEALCSLLCCGSIFEQRADEDQYFKILDDLLNSTNENLCAIFVETLSSILTLNEQCTRLFEWTISACYTRPNSIAVKAFKALTLLFSKREFPCDFVCLFVLCQVYALDSDASVRESAILLIQILRRQFLDDALPSCKSVGNDSANGSFLSSSIVNESPQKKKRPIFPINFDAISRDLSSNYTQLTMPIVSEIFSRFENARSNRQAAMLSILLQWIRQIELVDPFCELTSSAEALSDESKGWGSSEATQLLLNNLIYVTAKFLDEHGSGIAALWKSLAKNYASNLPIIVHIMFVLISLSPEFFIPVVKHISEYLLDSCGNQFISMLMEQLANSGEQFKLTLVRSDIPPFYRWQQQSETSDTPQNTEQLNAAQKNAPETENAQNGVIPSDPKNVTENEKVRAKHPRQLPLPAYGGHYSALNMFLPPFTQPVAYFSRSNLALFLLSELIGADNGCGVDWKSNAQVLLNVSVISLDSSRPLVCRHARLAILYLCLHFAPHDINVGQIANELLAQKCNNIDLDNKFIMALSTKQSIEDSSFELNESNAVNSQAKRLEYRRNLFFSNQLFPSSNDLLMALCYCLTDLIDRPLWTNEEVSVKNWQIESADQLGCFVRHLAEYFINSLHNLAYKWTEFAMQTALTTSNRHIAGRCFQISAALCQNLAPYTNQLISRLVEFVGEYNDDAQCYLTHMILCLHASVPQIIKKGSQIDKIADSSPMSHTRSISYTAALLQNLTTSPSNVQNVKKDARFSLVLEEQKTDLTNQQSNMINRCKSATLIDASMMDEDALNALSQLIAVCACLLESEIDNEILLAFLLLNQIFESSGGDRVECVKRFDNTVNKLNWTFNGIIPLSARGIAFPSSCENAISILRQSIDLLDYSSIGSSSSFPLIVIAVLPYCLIHFDAPTEIGKETARSIAHYCVKMLPDPQNGVNCPPSDHPLHNLATMMNQYQENSFTRGKFLWAKCVTNYLLEAFSPNVLDLIVFVCEVLERSASSMHIYLLHIIYLLISHGDLNNAFPSSVNTLVVRVVMKHIQLVNWKEAARILKTILDQWNRISVNQVPQSEEIAGQRKPDFDLFIDKIETYSPQSPRKLVNTQQSTGGNVDTLRRQANSTQARIRERLISLLPASGLPIGLPRTSSVIFSQSSSDVHYDGVLQAAASNSAFSSSEVVSHQDDELESTSIGNESATDSSFPRVFKEFDFLEAERDTISETESCFNWLSTMRPLCSVIDDNTNDAEEPDNDDLNEDDINQVEDEMDDEIDFTIGRSSAFMSGQRRRRRFSRPMSRASDSASANDISSDRTPIQSEKHSDDSLPSCSSDEDDNESTDIRTSSSNRKNYPSIVPNLASPIESTSAASYQINEDSALNILETNSSIFESSKTQRSQVDRHRLYLECSHHISNNIERSWLNCVQDIETDGDGSITSQCILGVTQVLREGSVKLSLLLRDAHSLYPTNESSRIDISGYFSHALNVVLRLADMPFLFVTSHYLRSTNLLQAQKFTLYQLKQHFETFLERKEQSIRALNGIKSSLKLQNFGSQSSCLSIASQEVDLCICFEKLFFQMSQMLDKFYSIYMAVQGAPNSQDFTLAPSVISMHKELLSCISETPLPESRLPSSSLSIAVNEQLTDILALNLTNKNYRNALITLHQLRSQFGSEFGCCEHMDVDALLIQYCQSHKLKTWALIGSIDILQMGCHQLQDKSRMFGALIRTLKTDAASSIRSSRVSSVNESLYNTTTHTS